MFEAPLDVVDRICVRWAVAVGGGAEAAWADTISSKPPPLPDDLAVEVDQVIMHAPTFYPGLLRDWYRKPYPAAVIARRNGFTNEKAVYPKMREALGYLLGKFEALGVIARFNARART